MMTKSPNEMGTLPSLKVDLASCAKERIHTPGMIQPHGLLLVLEGPELTIKQASTNSSALVHRSPEELVGHGLEELAGSDQIEHLRMILRGDSLIRANPLKLRLPNRPEGRAFDVLVHAVDSQLVLEAEPIDDGAEEDFRSFYYEVRQSTAKLQATESEEMLCQVAADEVRRITGYDRVMVYRFDRDWNGMVAAESQDDRITSSYLGLHFPASDIPSQARSLYTSNRLRCIPDASYTPVGLLAAQSETRDTPLDMSQCVLRSVSPIHLEYLRNMGVGATMSVSLIKNGELWGLIACHHYEPKRICPERRLTCSFLGEIIEAQLKVREDGAERAYRVQTSAIQVRFLDLLARTLSISGLAGDVTSVLDFVDAQGAAVVQNMNCTLVGRTPKDGEIPGLLDLMSKHLVDGVFCTDSLAAVYPVAEKFKDVASGMLGLEISRERGEYLLWFRPEHVRVVNWAGDPDKPVSQENGSVRLHPRKSFELWKQAVTLHSKRWKPAEIAAVVELNDTFHRVIDGGVRIRSSDLQGVALTELSQHALEGVPAEDLFREAAKLISQSLGVEICRLLQKLPGSTEFSVLAEILPQDIAEILSGPSSPQDALSQFVMSSPEPLLVDDLRTEVRFDGRNLYDLLGVVSGIAVAIVESNDIFGVITAYAHRAKHFDHASIQFVQKVASILMTAVHRKRVEEKLGHRSQHDDLTGLPNRSFFLERLGRTIQNTQSPPALLLIDLDRFKDLNDTYGHHFGDILLRQVARRLRETLRRIDTLARLGGDEFVVLLPRTCERDAIEVAQGILAELRTPFIIENRTCFVGASIGIAICPRHGDDPGTLMRRADVAMYVAKESGGGFTVYAADQDEYKPGRLDLVSDLRIAIDAGELVLHYQPKLDLKTRRAETVEALARWFHPAHGAIPPSRFIPMAEHEGLMGQLGRWSLKEAILQREKWLTQDLDLGIAVNVSPRLLHDNAIYQAALEGFGNESHSNSWLTLEITESTVMRDPKGAIAILARLRSEFGLKVSVDDFGIGHSSLAYLRYLPVDELKIDREFIKNMATSKEDVSVVRMIIELGHNLGLRVVAEGVEDRDTLEILASLDCDFAQGYLISRPISAKDLAAWAKSNPLVSDRRGPAM